MKGTDERAKEEASKWEDAEKAKHIIELFETGYHLRDIRDAVFPNWGEGLKMDEKLFRKHIIDYIVLKVLECENWEEYGRKQTRLRNLRIQREKGKE